MQSETKKKGRGFKVDFTDPMILLEVELYARNGYDDYQIADCYGIDKATFARIKAKKQPDGSKSQLYDSLSRGRRPLNIIVENSLYKRAIGMKVITTKVITKREFNPAIGDFEINIYDEVITTELPPDVAAHNLWLRNRMPDIYNQQPTKVDHTTNGKDMPGGLVFMSTDELTESQIQDLIKTSTGKSLDL